MLGKQWKAEADEIKTHFKALADEEKRKHAENHPGYQYATRKPSEKKRRASSRQHSKLTQPSVQADSPISTNGQSTASTPAINMGNFGADESIQDLVGLNLVLGRGNLQDNDFNFDTDAFDAMVKQVHYGHNKPPYQQLNLPCQSSVDSFEFSEFITDFF